jgi:hypothetical protein
MKRFGYLAVLMVLSSSAYAGEQVSFTVAGHRVRIEAPRYCRSASCVSVSIPGIYEARRGRDRYDDRDESPAAAPARPLAAASVATPAPVSAPPAVLPQGKPSVQPIACTPPRQAPVTLAASTTQEVAAPPPAAIQLPATPPMTPPMAPPVTRIEMPPVAALPATDPAPQLSKVRHDAGDRPAETPIGDWRTEGKKGTVRIEPCGRALCGYILNSASNAVGETVLINMKPKVVAEWSGTIYSRDSGNTYYATMAMKGPNSLRVEACALGKFFCSGNLWSRIAQPEEMVTSRQASSAPRS